MFVVLSGHVAITQRDGLGHVTPVIDQGPGQFLAEIGQLSGRVALVDGHAEGDVETLLIPPDKLRALLVAEADLGERIMRALILRRVSLIQGGVGGPVLIGPASLGDMARLQNFLARNGHPHHLLDPATDTDAADLVARYSPSRADLPLVVCPDGTVLRNPPRRRSRCALGMIGNQAHEKLYDVAVVGSGPAGLATAVYAASEGLSVAVLDARAFGGQAGASARIENYLGFPTGISGQALAGRAFIQAQKFGAEMLIPVAVKSLDCSQRDGAFALATECGQSLRAQLRRGRERRALPPARDRKSRRLRRPRRLVLGLADRGQAVRRPGGRAGRRRQFRRTGRGVPVRPRAQGLHDDPRRRSRRQHVALSDRPHRGDAEHRTDLQRRGDRRSRATRRLARTRALAQPAGARASTLDVRNLFLFVGADPATGWLDGCGVTVDRGGFVVTGAQCGQSQGRPVPPLETTVPGVFAVGDVRSGSVKRVGGAIGEGAQVVAALHGFLADAMKPAHDARIDGCKRKTREV